MTEDTRNLPDDAIEMVDNNVDVSMEVTVPPDYHVYAEIDCDCGRWVHLVVGNVTKECECGQTWTLKAAKVDIE